jgi:hypothetical protein
MTMRFKSSLFGLVQLVKSYYRGGRMALRVTDMEGLPLAILTVNIPQAEHLLKKNEFFVKTWSENAEIAADALKSGLFKNTGSVVEVGNVTAQIWRFAKPSERK